MKTQKNVVIVIAESRLTIPATERISAMPRHTVSGRHHELGKVESQTQVTLPAGMIAAYVSAERTGGPSGVYVRVVRMPDEPEFPGETGAVVTA